MNFHFNCIKSMINKIVELGGKSIEIQGQNCLFAPSGYFFNIILCKGDDDKIIYSGVGLSLDQDAIMFPAGQVLKSENGVTTYGTGIIRPVKVNNVKIDLVPS